MIIEDLTPFTAEDAKAARAHKFTFVCSMCTRLHSNRKHLRLSWEGARCGAEGCNGPVGDKLYPRYEGPLKGALARFCWLCGKENPESTLAPPDGSLVDGELLGCCNEHAKLLKEGSFDRRPAGTRATRKVRIAGHVIDL